MTTGKRKRRKREKINALHTFINAVSYQYAAGVLNDHQFHKDHLMWPLIVNEAFALELFLKCLHESKRRVVEGHSARWLYDKLSKIDRKSIELRYNAIVVGHPHYQAIIKHGVLMDIDAVLQRVSKLFTGGRYWHEGIAQNLSRDDNGFATNAGVGSLSDSIRDVLYEYHPDWRDKLPNFRWKYPEGSPHSIPTRA